MECNKCFPMLSPFSSDWDDGNNMMLPYISPVSISFSAENQLYKSMFDTKCKAFQVQTCFLQTGYIDHPHSVCTLFMDIF